MNLDEIVKAYSNGDKEGIILLHNQNPNNKNLWYLMCRMCEQNDIASLEWLIKNFNVSKRIVYEYDCFVIKQTVTMCKFAVLRWLKDNFDIPSQDLKKCNIYACIENFNINELDDMLWFCDEIGITSEIIQNICLKLPPINRSKSGEIKEKMQLLVEALDQGPLIKFAGKL
jgi:hypothetical protein